MALDARARRLAVVSFDADFSSATAGELGRGHRASRLGSGDALQLAALRDPCWTDSVQAGPGDVQRQPVPHLGPKPSFRPRWSGFKNGRTFNRNNTVRLEIRRRHAT